MENFFNTIRNSIEIARISFSSEDNRIVYIILGAAPSEIEEIVLLPAVDSVFKIIKKSLKNSVKRGLIINGTLGKYKVSLVKSGVGAPSTAMILEALRRTNCKTIFRIDLCGALSKTGSEKNKNACNTEIKIADVVVPDSFYHTDGTSLGYIEKYYKIIQEYSGSMSISPESSKITENQDENKEKYFEFEETQSIKTRIYPNFKNKYVKSNILPRNVSNNYPNNSNSKYIDVTTKLYQSCLKILTQKKTLSKSQLKCPNSKMILWSEDALFCEDVRSIATWRYFNAKIVDMESSIIMLFSKLFKIPAIPILVVSDIVDSAGNEWFAPKPEKIRILQNVKRIIEILPQILDEFHQH